MLNFNAWVAWIRSLDSAWLFVLILIVVVAVVGMWSSSLKPDKTKESPHE